MHASKAGLVAVALWAPWLSSCAADEGPGQCLGGKCDSAVDVGAELEGRLDPVAEFLRSRGLGASGQLELDYLDVVEGVAEQSGCGPESIRSFVLADDLVAGTPFPRVVSTVCSDDPGRVTDFFIAASFPDREDPTDVDIHNLEMFAWDAQARTYNFYAALPLEDDLVQVEVEPRRCQQCHLSPDSLDDRGMPMLPIMNELTAPWPHWNAEPDFPSHTFELPAATAQAPNYRALTEGRLASAAELEQIVRDAHVNRAIAARLRLRRERPAVVEDAMALLRPLFCAEQVNYVTEDHASGVLPADAVIAGGTREMFLAIRPSDWPWSWLNDGLVRMNPQPAEPVSMLPVRGHADVEYERRLVALGVLTPEDVLRVRALDWREPVFSELRCGLWKDARARLRAAPPSVDLSPLRNSELMPLLYREIMSLGGHSLLYDDGRLLAVDHAERADALAAALADGSAADASCTADGFCAVDLEGLGDLLDRHHQSFAGQSARAPLFLARQNRLCRVIADFPNRPAFAPPLCDGFRPEASKEMGLEGTAPPPLTAISHPRAPIPDGDSAGAPLPLAVDAGDFVPQDFVSVRVAIGHGWRGDLALFLTAPGGDTVQLAALDPADSADHLDEHFIAHDLATGADARGDWTLTVVDRQRGETGVVDSWSLGINQFAPRVAPDGARLPPGF